MKTLLLTGSLVAGMFAFGSGPGIAQEVPELPPSGTTHFTTYFSLYPAKVVEMVDDSSMTVAELVGVTVNPDGEPHFHNMVVHCVVSIRVIKGEQDLYGACRETDRDGDYRPRRSTARLTTSLAAPASTRGSPAKRRLRLTCCPHRVRGWAR